MAAVVLGATGFIGNAVAVELVRLGYEPVFGTTRREEKRAQLASQGITAIIGDVKDVDLESLVSRGVCLIVECVGDYSDRSTQGKLSVKVIEALGAHPELNAIFTSGVFCYGQDEDRFRVLAEGDGYSRSYAAGKARIPVEAAYRAAGACVINPVMVYGQGGGALAYTMRKFLDDKEVVELPSCFGDGTNMYSTVHVRDLATLYGIVARRAPELRGQLFNASAHVEPYNAVAAAIQAHFPEKRVVWKKSDDAASEAWGGHLLVSGLKARRQLGWNPVHLPFIACTPAEVANLKASL